MKCKKIIYLIILLIFSSSLFMPVVNATDVQKKQTDVKKNVVRRINNINSISDNSDKEVEFEDENFKNYLLQEYDTNKDGKIIENEMEKITYLCIYSYNLDVEIKSLSGLEKAINLQELYISLDKNTETDISAIYDLNNLESLSISQCNVDINKLSKMTTIENLSLYYINNKNIDISLFENLTNLKVLNLSDVSFNLSDLEKLKSLKSLSLYSEYDNIQDFSMLNKLKNLEKLDISSSINSLDGLENMANLKELSIYQKSNAEIDFSKISNLTNLTYLSISSYNTNLPLDMNIVKNLNSLTNLKVYSNNIINYEAIGELTNLTDLCISGNYKIVNLTNLNFVSKLSNLTYITIQNTNISDISELANLTNLINISLISNKIQDISPLKNLEKLSYVTLRRNPINQNEEKNAETLNALRNRNVIVDINDFDDSQIIEFKDPNLEQSILSSYGSNGEKSDLNNDGKISVYEMESLTELNIYSNVNEKIKDLTELKYAKNLTKLTLSYYMIDDNADLSPIKSLTTLRTLSCNKMFDKLSKANIFNELINLEEVEIIEEENVDLTYLSSIPTIEKLKIQRCININNQEQIANLHNLKELEFDNNYNYSVTNIDGNKIATNKNIEILKISNGNNIDNIDAIWEMSNIKELKIPTNANIQGIGKAIQIESLILEGKLEEIQNIQEINKIPSLQKLQIAFSNSSSAEYYEIDVEKEQKVIDELQGVTCNNIIFTGYIEANLGIIGQEEQKEIAYQEICPLIKAFLDKNNKLYMKNFELVATPFTKGDINNESKTLKIDISKIGSLFNTTFYINNDHNLNLSIKGFVVKKEDITSINLKKLLEKLPETIDLNIKEIEYEQGEEILKNKINELLRDYNTSIEELKKKNYEIDINISPLGGKKYFYEAYINFNYCYDYYDSYNDQTFETQSCLYNTNVNVTYSNTKNYKVEDERKVQALKITPINYIGLDIKDFKGDMYEGDDSTYKKVMNKLSEEYTKEVNDKTITVKLLSGSGGGDRRT